MNNSKNNIIKNLKFDLPASLVVFLVALPLCLGISLASTSYSDVDGIKDSLGIVFPGIIAGIVGGIVVGLTSGSRFGVSGPAAGLITIVVAAIIEFGGFENGGFEKFILAVAIAGVFQLILGFLKAGFIAYYLPFSVIKGMLAGIGITIILKQIPHFFGYDNDPEGEMSFHQVDGENTFSEISIALNNIHYGSTIIAFISLAILLTWALPLIQKNKILKLIPGALLVIIASIIINLIFSSFGNFAVAGDHLVNVPTPSNFDEFKSLFYTPNFYALNDLAVYKIALVITAVASIETLLCVEATDKLDPHKGRTPMNRELKAQGIGNIISGLLGGLPITQVIVRSSANINAKAESKNSAIIHGVLLLIFVIAAPSLLNMIPKSSLAAVLILIGFKLASPKLFKQMFKDGWSQFIPFITTIISMLLTDNLLTGVGVGLAVAVLWILYKNYQIAYFVHNDGQKEGEPIRLALSEHATFLNKANIIKTFDAISEGSEVIIDLSKTIDIDYDVTEAIEEFKTSAIDKHIKVTIINQKKVEMKNGMTSIKEDIYSN